jgi:hypothetical protein
MKASLIVSCLVIFVAASITGAQNPTDNSARRPRIVASDPMPSPKVTTAATQTDSSKPPSRVVVTDNLPKSKPVSTVQTSTDGSGKTSRLVVTNSMPAPRVIAAPTPPTNVESRSDDEEETSSTAGPTSSPVTPTQPVRYVATVPNVRTLSFGEIKSKIAEAKREMTTRPLTTSSPDPALATSLVRIAFYDWTTHKIDFVAMNKDAFLAKSGYTQTSSAAGKLLTVTNIRANGVNTPVTLIDSTGQAQLPLLVQYPVEKGGRYIETAYYMSTHPGLVTPEVVNAGRLYVRNVIEIARQRLRERGINIDPRVSDSAERLATVEHVDHQRFRTEPPQNIFNDIFTLYALNEGQTFRYSVSSAGAGGMVQMIPSTYQMMRSRYPNVGLMPDFVEGMRNHVNATQAMLLYMQMTWNDLNASPTISGALTSGIATPQELMAAGYNSNPARLAGYIDRGGSNWTNLIPRETQIYLQIYDALEKFVPMTPRTR